MLMLLLTLTMLLLILLPSRQQWQWLLRGRNAMAAPWSYSAYQSALDLYDRLMAAAYGGGGEDGNANDQYNNVASKVNTALHDLEMAYRLHGPHCMIGSYNGGKDAVVIFQP